jgi:hypothetical protein
MHIAVHLPSPGKVSHLYQDWSLSRTPSECVRSCAAWKRKGCSSRGTACSGPLYGPERLFYAHLVSLCLPAVRYVPAAAAWHGAGSG